jgi:hypothetical protein
MNMTHPRHWIFPLLLCAAILGIARPKPAPAAPAPSQTAVEPLCAKWIWLSGRDVYDYNQTIILRKTFRAHEVTAATLRITADSYYRVFINGRWVNDGPCRSWPEHFQFDVIDAAPYLVSGANEIRVIARYYGAGDFHHVPRQAGFLAQLDMTQSGKIFSSIISDSSWEAANAPAWTPNTPKVSIQMEACELYDARLEDSLSFKHAAVLYDADKGPWKDLHARDTALLTKEPVSFKTFLGAKVVRADGWDFCLPAARLVHPGLIEANQNASCACGMATLLKAESDCTIELQNDGMRISVDGKLCDNKPLKLAAGKHLVLALVSDIYGHNKEKTARFMNPKGFTLENPLRAGEKNPWCFLRFPEYAVADTDLQWPSFRGEDSPLGKAASGFAKAREVLFEQVKDMDTFQKYAGRRAELMAADKMFVQDTFWQFTQRKPLGDASALVDHASGLFYDTPESTIVHPTAEGDVELLYDLGEQRCGYYQFDLMADAGVQVDIYGIEYITPEGRLQHSLGNRNGMRYITKAGVNHFTSLKRRSGRYVFITFRNLKTPARVRQFNVVESTYPVNYMGSFRCSDERLARIWDISTRTLKLCMEDTFTDCPLYEQTHWVGDARNESLLAYGVFGANDLARRCINITAQSLEHYPIAGCQTPSCWDCLLPAWSFLWGMSTWDHYEATGDKEWLRSIQPAVLKNLKGAEQFVNDRDLFSGPFWNMFDWSGADQGQRTVVHNSMFMVGAIDAALKEAEVLGDTSNIAWLKALRARLVNGINRLWDPVKQSYPDAIRDDGSISPSTCQHTSFLGLLYDIVPKENTAAALKNLTAPPEKMVRIGSPFAMLYLYETYEKFAMEDQIIREIYTNYLPMVESGATTVWESFPTGTTGSGGFPTRSHCHAWSSAPSRFLNRIILGVKETSPAGASVTISPRLNGLTWAQGTTVTARGPVDVSWKLEDKTLRVNYTVPEGAKAEFLKNNSLDGLKLVVNGHPVE